MKPLRSNDRSRCLAQVRIVASMAVADGAGLGVGLLVGLAELAVLGLEVAAGGTGDGEELVEGREAKLMWNGKHWRGRFKVFLSPRGGLTLAKKTSLYWLHTNCGKSQA